MFSPGSEKKTFRFIQPFRDGTKEIMMKLNSVTPYLSDAERTTVAIVFSPFYVTESFRTHHSTAQREHAGASAIVQTSGNTLINQEEAFPH